MAPYGRACPFWIGCCLPSRVSRERCPGIFRACVNLGWKKLDKYYALSDATPAYRLAIFLHPCFKRRWFERHWMGKTAWLESADEVMKRAWQYAKRRWPNEVTMSSPKQQEMDAFDAYNHDIDDDTDNDELARYLREERAPQGTRPLTWWREHHHRFLLPRHSRSRSSQRLQALAPTSESFRWLETSLTKSDQTQWRSWRRFTRVYAAGTPKDSCDRCSSSRWQALWRTVHRTNDEHRSRP